MPLGRIDLGRADVRGIQIILSFYLIPAYSQWSILDLSKTTDVIL